MINEMKNTPGNATPRRFGWDMLTVEESQRRTECIWGNPEALRRISAQ